jgi:UDP-2,4-diacetamido-2,4,6-trideoxy-beta-L-altropyranose hydrolase
MRCLAIAEALRPAGWQAVFATGNETLATVSALAGTGFEIERLPDNASDADQLARRFRDGADLLVVDHYGRDASFERACRAWARRILVLDDATGRDHDCDLLLDAAATDPRLYRDRVPAGAQLLLGPAYATVRPEFLAMRAAALARRDGRLVRNILVSLGATDPMNATCRVLDALEPLPRDVEVTLVLSSRAPHLAEVQRRAQGAIKVMSDVADIAGLMSAADLAIGGAGSSAYERAVLGLPTVMVELAANQSGVCSLLADAGAASNAGRMDGDFSGRLRAMVQALMDDSSARIAMAKAASTLVDGRGAQRVMIAIGGETEGRDRVRVRLRLADASDEDWLLDLQREPGARQYARNPAVPTAQEHAHWMRRMLADADVELMLVEANAAPAGMVRLDRLSASVQGAARYEVSIAIRAAHRNQGFASAALRLVRSLKPAAVLEAEILPANAASIELFHRAGFASAGSNRYRSVPAHFLSATSSCPQTSS